MPTPGKMSNRSHTSAEKTSRGTSRNCKKERAKQKLFLVAKIRPVKERMTRQQEFLKKYHDNSVIAREFREGELIYAKKIIQDQDGRAE